MADVRRIARRLRDLCEPIASQVYFVPEAQDRYRELGLDYGTSYFLSRGAALGRPSGWVVAATFGVFNPAVVVPIVESGWTKTDPASILAARQGGAVAALERMLGKPDTAPAVEILQDVMTSVTAAGRPIFAGLVSLPVPTSPLGALWRSCDLVRERRGDGHIAAWISAGCDAVEIGLLTELYWGLQLGTYIRTRSWADDEVAAGIERLEKRGLVASGAFTDEGRGLRRGIEEATDRMDADVVEALGDRAEGLFALLEPWTRAILEQKGYPSDPATLMNRD